MAATHGKNAFFFVLVTVFLDMVGFGLIMPVLPDLISELTGTSIAEAVKWAGPITAIYALMNFLCGPVLGNLSDKYGRRPVLLFSVAMLGFDFLIMALSQNIWMLFVGRALSGVSGATFSTAQAYIADVTEPERRGGAFGMIGAAFGLGFIIGPALGGFLGDFHTRAPFFAAAALSLINFCYGAFVLPESLDAEERRPFDIKRANPFGAFKHFSKLPMVSLFLVTLFLYSMSHTAYASIWSYHGAIRYDWDERTIGLSLTLVGLTAAIVQGALTGRLISRFGAIKTAWLGLCVNTGSMLLFAFAGQGWMAFAIIVISGLGGVQGPSVQSIMSNQTPKNAQGELQGATASLQSIAMIISPLIMTSLLHAFSTQDAPIYFPGAPFLLAAALVALAAIPFSIGVARIRAHAATTDASSKAEAPAE